MIKYILLLTIPFFAYSSIDTMTLEEKVGQLLLVHFKGEKGNKDSIKLLKEAHVGGFIYYNWTNTLSSPSQVQTLSHSLQRQNKKYNSLPLFIAVDQEGGRVSRLKEGFTQIPSAHMMGSIGLPALIEQAALVSGKEMRAVGINMNLAPVVDVVSKPENNGIGDRSYGRCPLLVSECGDAALKGYRKGNTIGVLKHFPGHGDASGDSHTSSPFVAKSNDELEEKELVPFQKLVPLTDAIMTAHLLVPALDPDEVATFSKPILNDLLRKKWGFQGVIISDSLVMKGASAASYEEAALKALNAGCDILCLGGKQLQGETEDELKPSDVIRIHQYLVQAVHEGKLPLEDLNAKVKRIYDLKQKYQLQKNRKAEFASDTNLMEEIKTLASLQNRLTQDSLRNIGDKIWKNECSGKKEGLVSWNQGENFMSLGIGHFIWYPERIDPKFDTAFPKYLIFLQTKGAKPAQFDLPGAPWPTREAFLADPDNPFTESLRNWLFETQDLQAEFIVKRFMTVIDQILQASPDQKSLLAKIQALTTSDEGLFALIDYVNFKGDGLSPKERYNGKGWGLYPVLQAMKSNDLDAFKQAAIEKLEERVANSDPARNESRWLPGWKNRILRY